MDRDTPEHIIFKQNQMIKDLRDVIKAKEDYIQGILNRHLQAMDLVKEQLKLPADEINDVTVGSYMLTIGILDYVVSGNGELIETAHDYMTKAVKARLRHEANRMTNG